MWERNVRQATKQLSQQRYFRDDSTRKGHFRCCVDAVLDCNCFKGLRQHTNELLWWFRSNCGKETFVMATKQLSKQRYFRDGKSNYCCFRCCTGMKLLQRRATKRQRVVVVVLIQLWGRNVRYGDEATFKTTKFPRRFDQKGPFSVLCGRCTGLQLLRRLATTHQ